MRGRASRTLHSGAMDSVRSSLSPAITKKWRRVVLESLRARQYTGPQRCECRRVSQYRAARTGLSVEEFLAPIAVAANHLRSLFVQPYCVLLTCPTAN